MMKKDILKEMVDKTVREVLSERKKTNLDLVIESVVNEQLKKLIKEDEDVNNKKRSVIQWLKQDTVNTAAIRRKVEGKPEDQEEEDAKRSYFMKKVNQTDGKDFSDEEVNDLYKVKSELGQ